MMAILLSTLILLLVVGLFYWKAERPTQYRCKLYDKDDNYLGTCAQNSIDRYGLYDAIKDKYWSRAVETENGYIDKDIIKRIDIDERAPI